MRILLVNDLGVPFGGAELQIMGLRDELRRRGHEVCFFSSSARPGNLPLHADEVCCGSVTPLRLFLQVANPWAVAHLHRLLQQFRPDVVHVNLFLTQLSPLILPILRSVPSVYYAVWYRMLCPTGFKRLPNGSDCHNPPGWVCCREGCISSLAWGPYMATLHLGRHWRFVFDRVVACSMAVSHMLADAGIAPDAIIWPGVPLRPVRPPLGNTPVVAYAARLVREKGGDVLLYAFAQVVRQLPEAQLIVVGSGPEHDHLVALIQNLGLVRHVTMMGHLPHQEMERCFDAAWVQVVPSRWREPFGMVATDAAMRGTAVIASDTGGLSEIVLPGETGYLVPPGDVDALAAALLTLLQDRTLAEHMGQAAAERARTHFSLPICTDRFLQLYQELIPSTETGYIPTGTPTEQEERS